MEESERIVFFPEEAEDLDGLNYLAGKIMEFVNHASMEVTILAHETGNVPVMRIKIPKQDAYTLGQMFYFFCFACGVRVYIGGINPFDQQGVESYMRNMFALLGKPGF